ncbi:MAG: IS1380 family transposase, partial [Acidobacteria bacterium]|nr:IS1380 family transposase [Acidobacteriota bacterium]
MKKLNNKEARPSDASVCPINLPSHPDRKVVARFDGGRLSSDAGLVCVWALDQQQRLTEDFAACIRDVRDGRYIRHEISEMATQRSFQIVAGYEDCNDADSLRRDPIFKTVCSRLPEGDPDLACQSTLSRLENSVSRKDLFRIGEWFCDSYLKRRKKSKPKKITLDVDSTDDPTHGQQELSFYHGFYREHIYHPLLIFDADTGDLITALLRPGNRGAAAGVVSVLKRLVKKMRRKLGKKLQIEIRADSGFATPALYDFCESEKLSYVIGFARNSRVQAGIEAF